MWLRGQEEINNVQNFYKPLIVKWVVFFVFRTAAEISARLSFLGNIKQPMALQALGKMLTCHSYMSLRTTGGKRGYFVVEHTNNQKDAQKIIEELNQ